MAPRGGAALGSLRRKKLRSMSLTRTGLNSPYLILADHALCSVLFSLCALFQFK